MEPKWLQDGIGFAGTVEAFVPLGRKGADLALIKLDSPLYQRGVTGSFFALSLRFVGTGWADDDICHVHLCAERPADLDWWRDETKFALIESHAHYWKRHAP